MLEEEPAAVQVRQLKQWIFKELQVELPNLRRQLDHKPGQQGHLAQLQRLNNRDTLLREILEILNPSGSEKFQGRYDPGDFLGADDSSDPRAILMEEELADL